MQSSVSGIAGADNVFTGQSDCGGAARRCTCGDIHPPRAVYKSIKHMHADEEDEERSLYASGIRRATAIMSPGFCRCVSPSWTRASISA